MINRVISCLLLTIVMIVSGCGEEDPNALIMCPEFDPTEKYSKPSDNEKLVLWNTCIPNELGVPLYFEMSDAIIVKLKESRKFLQLKFSILTKHDFFAQRKIEAHEQMLKASFTERMLNVSESDTELEGYRKTLAEDFKRIANEAISEIEGPDYPAVISSVLITSYVVE